MAIPDFTNVAGKMVLPEGVHPATLDEVRARFGSATPRRVDLMKGLETAFENFRAAKIAKVYIDGSFTTDKEEPNDIDGCWEHGPETDEDSIDPVFWDFSNDAKAMKMKYGLHFFPALAVEAGSGLGFPEFFQQDRDGNRKGIVVVSIDDA